MTLFCFFAGILCLLYFVLILIYSGFTSNFYLIWPAISAVCCLLGWLFHTGFLQRLPYGIKCMLLLCAATGFLVFFGVEGMILKGGYMQPGERADYVIVLGAHVRPEGVSKALALRLDRALEYAGEYPDTVFIVSGGKGANEPCSEASAMYDYLVRHGMESEKIILEDQSTNTRENMLFSKAKLPENTSVGIISNDFHMTRALHLAKELGISNPIGIPAKSDLITQPANLLREFFAVIKDFILIPLM